MSLSRRRSQGFPDIFDKKRIENADASKIETLLPFVKYRTRSDTFDFQSLKALQSLDKIRGKRLGGFDFDRRERTLSPDEQVDLVAVRVAVEIYLRPEAPVEGTFHDIRHDEVLIQVAA